eukprot:gene7844-7675_t
MTPHFGLIIVGDEILSGKRADKHMPKVIELLAARGLSLSYADYVGDNPARLTATLQRAFASGDMVFSCGGIGATPDDHTRQCAGAALGRELVLHEGAAALIRERMQDVAREQGVAYESERADNLHRLNMGVFPQGAEIIPNPYNKIPGFSCLGEGGGRVHFVPGFPVMAWPMMEWVLDRYYQDHFHSAPQVERSLIVFGAMESSLTPLMEQIEQSHHGLRVFSLPSVDHPQYGRHIELGVKGPKDLENLMAKTVADVMKMVKENEVKFVDFRFTDTRGKQQHTTVPVSHFDEDKFISGHAFDGSSIAGWKGIEASDMQLIPDPSTANIDPFFEETTLILTCDVIEPSDGKAYDRDPRSIAKRAEAYLKASGLGDTAYFGPEPEFFIFDGVRWSTEPNNTFYEIDEYEAPWNTGAKLEGGNRGHRPTVKGGYFPVPPVDSTQDMRAEMSLILESLGIPVEVFHHEVAGAGQNEI